jgi:hypothetical protein
LVELDAHGERLRGCLSCNTWQVVTTSEVFAIVRYLRTILRRSEAWDLNGAGRGDEPERLVFAMSELPLWKKLKGVHFGKPEDQPLILALLIVLIGLSLWLLI